MAASLSELDWQVRLHIYRFFIEHGRPPTVGETVRAIGMSEEDVDRSYRRLDEAHVILLDPGTSNVRIANPLSAVETPYRVTVNGSTLYANCAFDSLGIPAMLGADATIETVYTDAEGSGDPARYAIVTGALCGDDGIVHFSLPFRHWYDNQVHT